MRYTTVIDIREIPEVYRNQNCRLLYLHLALMAGYHDADRDRVRISIRRLADSCGLTVSATRHATNVLVAAKLLRVKGGVYLVRKYCEEQPITTRAKAARAKKAEEQRSMELQEAARQEAARQEDKAAIMAVYEGGKTPFMQYYESKLALAAQGDADAEKIVQSRRAQYLEHCAAVKGQKA